MRWNFRRIHIKSLKLSTSYLWLLYICLLEKSTNRVQKSKIFVQVSSWYNGFCTIAMSSLFDAEHLSNLTLSHLRPSLPRSAALASHFCCSMVRICWRQFWSCFSYPKYSTGYGGGGYSLRSGSSSPALTRSSTPAYRNTQTIIFELQHQYSPIQSSLPDCKCNFPMKPHGRWLFCWSVIIS